MRRLAAIVAFMAALPAVWAADDPALPGLAVQSRRHTQTPECTAAVGVLPLDAFEKGLTVSGAYTLHFTDVFAWEVAHFFWSFPLETDLRDELNAFDIEPTPFERVEYFLTTNFVFKPLYWKGAWLNDGLAFGELMFLVGGGYGWMTRSERPVADIGVAYRLYVSESVSLRLDVRDHAFFNAEDIQNELWIGLGVSL
jgi:outer membrane beta-barrel protein